MTDSFNAQCQEHLEWMKSLLSNSSSISQTTSKIGNVYEDQINELLDSINSTPRPSDINEVCKTFSNLNHDIRPSIEPSPLIQPNTVLAPQYRISDPVDSDNSSDCEEYYVEDAEEIRGQIIPEWARSNDLFKELKKQEFVDPDKIFVGFQKSCDLDEMFQHKNKSFKKRGDSGYWAADELTPQEEAKYKKAIGLI